MINANINLASILTATSNLPLCQEILNCIVYSILSVEHRAGTTQNPRCSGDFLLSPPTVFAAIQRSKLNYKLSSISLFIHLLNADMSHQVAVFVGFSFFAPVKAFFGSIAAAIRVVPKVWQEGQKETENAVNATH